MTQRWFTLREIAERRIPNARRWKARRQTIQSLRRSCAHGAFGRGCRFRSGRWEVSRYGEELQQRRFDRGLRKSMHDIFVGAIVKNVMAESKLMDLFKADVIQPDGLRPVTFRVRP